MKAAVMTEFGDSDVQWEIDIFGGTRQSVESADARLDATAELQHDTLLAVVAEVARN